MKPQTRLMVTILVALTSVSDAFFGNRFLGSTLTILSTLYHGCIAMSAPDTTESTTGEYFEWKDDWRWFTYFHYLIFDILAILLIVFFGSNAAIKGKTVTRLMRRDLLVMVSFNILCDTVSGILVLFVRNSTRGANLIGNIQGAWFNFVVHRWFRCEFRYGFKPKFLLSLVLSVGLSGGIYIVGSLTALVQFGEGDLNNSISENPIATVIRLSAASVTGLQYLHSFLTRLAGWMWLSRLTPWRVNRFRGNESLRKKMLLLFLIYGGLSLVAYVAYVLICVLVLPYTCKPNFKTAVSLFPFQPPGYPEKTVCSMSGDELRPWGLQAVLSICGIIQRGLFPLVAIFFVRSIATTDDARADHLDMPPPAIPLIPILGDDDRPDVHPNNADAQDDI